MTAAVDSSVLGGSNRYRKAGGKRLRLIADFLIGAHAAMRATRLATKDDGFFRAQFRKLSVVRPA